MLFWGILGALLMRGAMIAAGAYLIEQFHWVMYVVPEATTHEAADTKLNQF